MPVFGPIKRHDLIRYLARLGFKGPVSGGKHAFMIKGTIRIRLPNPHKDDIGVAILARVLRQAGISREEWESL